MPADSRDMVLVPHVPTEAMMRAWNEAVPDVVEPPHADGWTPPADTTFRARWHAALSASPVGEGLGASASPIPTAQAGGPVVGWQPIETAPKDGDDILAADDETGERVVTYWTGDCWSGRNGCKPTHWMPLPPAPSTTSTAEQEGSSEASAPNIEAQLSAYPKGSAIRAGMARVGIAPSPGEGDAPVARDVLLLASYCDDPACSEARPCAKCLSMCNVFRCTNLGSYSRELGPTPATPAGEDLREAVAAAFNAGWNARETGYGGDSDGRDRAFGAFTVNPTIFNDDVLSDEDAALQPQAEGGSR